MYSLSSDIFSYSSLKLGDFHYYGILEEKNYISAFDFYNQATKIDDFDEIISNAYYNLAIMANNGEGIK